MSCSGRHLMEIAGLEPAPLERPVKLPLLLYLLPEGVCAPTLWLRLRRPFLLAEQLFFPSYSGGLVRTTGIEPASSSLKGWRLYQFVYAPR